MFSHPIVRAAICLTVPPSDSAKLGKALRWAVHTVRPSPPDSQWRDKACVIGDDLVVAYGSRHPLDELEHLFPLPGQNPNWWRELARQSDQFLIDVELLRDETLDPKTAPRLGRIRIIPDLIAIAAVNHVEGKAISEDRLLTVKEVAAWLGVSQRSVWQWAADGVIPPPIVLGRLRRWRLRDLEEWAAMAPRDVATADWREVLTQGGLTNG